MGVKNDAAREFLQIVRDGLYFLFRRQETIIAQVEKVRRKSSLEKNEKK